MKAQLQGFAANDDQYSNPAQLNLPLETTATQEDEAPTAPVLTEVQLDTLRSTLASAPKTVIDQISSEFGIGRISELKGDRYEAVLARSQELTAA